MSDLSATVNAGLFDHSAKVLGGAYANYTWKDAGVFGSMEDGEILNGMVPMDLTDPDIQKTVAVIRRKAEELAKTHIAFNPSKAMPSLRVFRFADSGIHMNAKDIPSTDRLFDRLKIYLALPALSCQEELVAAQFLRDLRALGFEAKQDEAHKQITCGDPADGTARKAATGNVIGVLKGDPALPSWHLSCHLDGTPDQLTPIPYVREGDIVRTTGDSILRGDDTAGIITILTVAEYLQQQKIPHGDIHVTGLVAEEEGACGAQHLAEADMGGDIGLVFDDLRSDRVDFAGGDLWRWELKVRGQGEHVALAPEVVNAQSVASQIMAMAWGVNERSLYHGDGQTVIVANAVESGTAYIDKDQVEKIRVANSVPDLAILKGQMRTKIPNSEARVVQQMTAEVQALCARVGAVCEFSAKLRLPGWQDPGMATIDVVRLGYQAAGLPAPKYDVAFGGSNINFLFPKRGEMMLIGTGASKIHTTKETLDLADTRRVVMAAVGMFVAMGHYRRVQ